MAGILEGAGLEPLLATVMRPWVSAVETASPGMHGMMASATSSTAASLKRRVVVLPALGSALEVAVAASNLFAAALDTKNGRVAEQRATALGALVVLIENLRSAEPSEDTRALGLGW
ncbi:hypothetical protein FV226_27250 [Methylobacterium sp. WL12]|uniref:hypothetical protein n=1 Tax=Methylobacterium sp. WL12 TaxID=2603890 RepID=UPI0011CBEF77|nr:hypothetical protein [Methylobacterium sp. WL12]TXM63787.1 hypothetical protein FV226_27250 [Methylobacterium sp. WL12]